MNESVRVSEKKSETAKEDRTSQTPKFNYSQTVNSSVDRILFLQKTIGNQAVGRLIKSGTLQLKIGQPNDVYEQEADKVAEQVVQIPAPVQRKCPKCDYEHKENEKEVTLQAKEASNTTPKIDPELESRISAIHIGGQPLPESVRAHFEPRFGYNFGNVKVHTDSNAVELARAVNALAYTVGNDVVFGLGQYDPSTISGQRLLAHELTHVVQQGRDSSFGNVVHRISANSDSGIKPTKSSATERLLALIAHMERVHSYTEGRLDSMKGEETRGEEGETKTSERLPPEGQDHLDSLKGNIEKLKIVANGDDESLKLSVLSAFTPQRLVQAEAQLNFVPRRAVAAQSTAIRIQEHTSVGMAAMPITMNTPQDAAEIEANNIASAVLTNGFVSIRQNSKQNVINRQIGPALVAAGSGLLVTEGEAAPAEIATGPPGWIIGAAIALTAVALIGAGYLLTRSKTCPPCPANPPPEIDRVPPSSLHYPCPGDHWHYREYNQNPQTCQCFLSGRLFGGCCSGMPGAPC